MGVATRKYLLGSITTLATTALNSVSNNANVACTVFDNTQGQTGDGYVLCDVEMVVTFGTNPTANTGITLWFLTTQDGTSYELGDASNTPSRLPDLVFPVNVSTMLNG